MKRVLALGGALVVSIVLLATCGDGDRAPEAQTSVAATAVRVAPSPTPVPTATATPVPSIPLSDPELATLVLATESIESTFPDLRLNTQHSGPVDNATAAEDSPVFGETAERLATQGRLGGYSSEYRNLLALFDPERQATGPSFVSSTVDLFGTAESARLYLGRWVAALENLIDRDLDGLVLEEIVEIEAPDLGEAVKAAHLDAVVLGFEIDFDGTLIAWARGRVVVALMVLGAGGEGWTDATEAAAREIDSLIVSSEALR